MRGGKGGESRKLALRRGTRGVFKPGTYQSSALQGEGQYGLGTTSYLANGVGGGGGRYDGGIGCNRSGTVNIQICVVGYGHKSFTRGKRKNAWVLADLADSWDIPWKARKRWPGSRSVKAWRKSGIHGHCHAPGNDHTDPGGIDIDKLMREARRQQKARRGRR